MAALAKRKSELSLLHKKKSFSGKSRSGKSELRRSQTVRGPISLEREDGNGEGGAAQVQLQDLQTALAGLDKKIGNLLNEIDSKMPTYNRAIAVLGSTEGVTRPSLAKHLVFYGVELDSVRLELIKDPNYTQDILEARLRSVLFEKLNIKRDIPMDTVYRVEKGGEDITMKPIVASLTNQADKWEILCSSRVKKTGKVRITEDIPGKRSQSREEPHYRSDSRESQAQSWERELGRHGSRSRSVSRQSDPSLALDTVPHNEKSRDSSMADILSIDSEAEKM